MRIRIQLMILIRVPLITLMRIWSRIRILPFNLMRILQDPDPDRHTVRVCTVRYLVVLGGTLQYDKTRFTGDQFTKFYRLIVLWRDLRFITQEYYTLYCLAEIACGYSVHIY